MMRDDDWECGSPPPWRPRETSSQSEMLLLLGELKERSVHTLAWFRRLDQRLDEGQKELTRQSAKISALETAKTKEATPMPGWEVALKRPLPWIIALVALALTGKLEVAVRLIEALGKLAAAVK